MSYCTECGTELKEKFLENEGMVPYCETCRAYRFPTYNVAISTIVYSPDSEKILLIKQYGRDKNILVAGYVNKGEAAEHALAREVREEMGLHVTECCFNESEYFAKSNTLMLNFASIVDSDDLSRMTKEVDYAAWYTPEEAKEAISHGSLAEKFLLRWLAKRKRYDKAYDSCLF
ncbi:NAD(+) diphosphatase [Qiania dongpingensis]|uniref:NAD(+) diphosphatase n=1 Tax=Qiania dongpingensis TaxID=2763669 RepID=A0A7G9G5V7_9FIRM|nr:NUDIX domain-containing protein [Qiania dongpingensis]QNM06189.1 NUDIX domain-containing protein [Qiania dongpingensis]